MDIHNTRLYQSSRFVMLNKKIAQSRLQAAELKACMARSPSTTHYSTITLSRPSRTQRRFPMTFSSLITFLIHTSLFKTTFLGHSSQLTQSANRLPYRHFPAKRCLCGSANMLASRAVFTNGRHLRFKFTEYAFGVGRPAASTVIGQFRFIVVE